jgi:ankyrin repeat protein
MPPKKPTQAELFETLIQACKDGDLVNATQAVDGGADVNKKTPDTSTPLFIAVEHKRKPIVEYFLSNGARIVEKIGQKGATALYQACFIGSLDIVKVLVDAGSDVNLKSSHGYACLFVAVQLKHKAVVEYLLSKGARIDEKIGPN